VQREVTAPDGTTWRVANRWYRRPRRHRFHERLDIDVLDGLSVPFDFGGDDIGGLIGGIVLGVVIVVLLGVLVVVLLPIVLFILEIPLVLALVFVIRRLWIIEAISGSGERRAWHVRGWLRSRRAVHEVARELELGVTAEPEESLGTAGDAA
jgi:hypothetical protein